MVSKWTLRMLLNMLVNSLQLWLEDWVYVILLNKRLKLYRLAETSLLVQLQALVHGLWARLGLNIMKVGKRLAPYVCVRCTMNFIIGSADKRPHTSGATTPSMARMPPLECKHKDKK